MKNIKQITSIIKKHKPELEQKFGLKEIGVFGSYVKNEQKRKSDVDILVGFKRPLGLFRFLDLEEYLETLLGKKVDLVSKKALKPYIGRYILREVVYI